MKFSIGDQVKIDCKGAPYHMCYGTITNHITTTMYEIDVLGILVEVYEMYLYPFKIAFKVGDKVCGQVLDPHRQWTVTKEWAVCQDDGGITIADEDGREYPIELRLMHLIFRNGCDHDWKRLDLFRTTEFHCPKCKAVRPFDITRDAA